MYSKPKEAAPKALHCTARQPSGRTSVVRATCTCLCHLHATCTTLDYAYSSVKLIASQEMKVQAWEQWLLHEGQRN